MRTISGKCLLAMLCAASSCAGQSLATKPAEYALDPITMSNCDYPSAAREQQVQGKVTARMLVAESGAVENVQVFKADPVLAQAVDSTIRGWKFKPIVSNGVPLAVIATVVCDFVADEKAAPRPELASAKEFPRSVRVSYTVMPTLIVSQVKPKYPPEAQAKRICGQVTVALVIGRDGSLSDVRAVSGPVELTSACVDAVRQWRFRPYLLLGRPVDVETTVQFNFN